MRKNSVRHEFCAGFAAKFAAKIVDLFPCVRCVFPPARTRIESENSKPTVAIRQRDQTFSVGQDHLRLVQLHARSSPVSQRLHSSQSTVVLRYIGLWLDPDHRDNHGLFLWGWPAFCREGWVAYQRERGRSISAAGSILELGLWGSDGARRARHPRCRAVNARQLSLMKRFPGHAHAANPVFAHLQLSGWLDRRRPAGAGHPGAARGDRDSRP